MFEVILPAAGAVWAGYKTVQCRMKQLQLEQQAPLNAVYDDVLEEPIPEEIAALLRSLNSKSGGA